MKSLNPAQRTEAQPAVDSVIHRIPTGYQARSTRSASTSGSCSAISSNPERDSLQTPRSHKRGEARHSCQVKHGSCWGLGRHQRVSSSLGRWCDDAEK